MGNKSMTLRCFTVDAFHDLPSRETEVIGASSSLLNVPHVNNLTTPYAKNSPSRLRYSSGNLRALRQRYALVCSGNDDPLFTFLATLTSKDIYAYNITMARKLLQPVRTCCHSVAKVTRTVGNLKVVKHSGSRVRRGEDAYYKLNNKSVQDGLDGRSILEGNPDDQDAHIATTTSLTLLRRTHQRLNQWATRWSFLGWISGIGRCMKLLTKHYRIVAPTRRYILYRGFGNKRMCGGEFGMYPTNSLMCRLLRCSNYGLYGNRIQRWPGFCHRFLTTSSMKRFLQRECSVINCRITAAQNEHASCDKYSLLKCASTDLLLEDTTRLSQGLAIIANQHCVPISQYFRKYAPAVKWGATHEGYGGPDAVEVYNNCPIENARYTAAPGVVSIYSAPYGILNQEVSHATSHATGVIASCDLVDLLPISHQVEDSAKIMESSQLLESGESVGYSSVMDVLRFKLFTERPLSEVFQSNSISPNIAFLAQYLFHRPLSLFFEAHRESLSLTHAVRTFLEDLGGDEDLFNALAVIAHSTTELPLDALETLLSYTHDDSYVMSDLRSILIRLMAEKCWGQLLARGYSSHYCNALRGIAPMDTDNSKQDAEKDGWTPWFRYVEQGNHFAVQCLIERHKGSHLSVFVSAMGYGPWLPTATMMTVILRNTQLFDILSHAETRMQDKCLGYSALMIAVLLGWDHAVKTLAHSKIITHREENNGRSGPYMTVQPSEIRMQDIMGKTALVCAAEANRAEYIDMLIDEAGLTDGVGTPAIAYAMDLLKMNIFKKLLPLECNCKDAVGNSILYYANKAKVTLFSRLVLGVLGPLGCKIE